MGIIPLFDWGEANALFLWIKVFEPFEDISMNSSMIYAILISRGCLFK